MSKQFGEHVGKLVKRAVNPAVVLETPGRVVGHQLLGPGAAAIGYTTGALAGPYTSEEERAANSGLTGLLPLVAHHRLMRRMMTHEDKFKKYKSELLGSALSPFLTAALGAAVNMYLNKDNPYLFKGDLGQVLTEGAAAGGLAGMSGNLLAHVLGFMAGKRDAAEREKYEQSSPWYNYLIPGVASYNLERSIRGLEHTPAIKG